MKKIITLCFLLVATVSLKAQQMSFDETVNYINKLFKENKASYFPRYETTGYIVTRIVAEKNGKIVIHDGTDIPKNLYLFDIKDWRLESNKWVYLLNKEAEELGHFTFYSAAEAIPNRLKNALVHLITMCKQEKDPFDN